ncbi:MAG: DUF433 domain-containing protein [Flavobacteriia bacterium]|nr:DUF433 domain-containing protein [Flavobacteriia bacterium]OIP45356.1 MAG: hypothetical protein AUK46_12485 [Flavobacteriaceae bacterium CG2_30_31_66]PIV97726.1 MAG: hypothetical protein COW43_01690 [Flavobacteriaceae bacterium CG17_big_fil_post_rev_8_21_14_2_50_31_13]PIY15500.1 MAG: hypothetical protein COZ16_03825 [Flavobacteriaceae bacterium CG_4_10_14_3_um_filter_31_253]PIZ11486.1 MAG: hypothetical protein COY55_04505 [Flavobacteriaceae bacterium CG_4_10_14_0_8_um_filter_31_99]PJC08779.
MENWQKHITINPEIRSGKPCIKGTRLTVADVLSFLASGMSIEEIIVDFPQLDKEKILAVLSFTANRESITKIELAS